MLERQAPLLCANANVQVACAARTGSCCTENRDGLMQVTSVIKTHEKGTLRALLCKGVRPDGRALDTVRPITSRASVLPRVHGSAMFTRGETQVCAIISCIHAISIPVVSHTLLTSTSRGLTAQPELPKVVCRSMSKL